MQISFRRNEYNSGNYFWSVSTMLGNITFPNDKGIATHLLTFLITGTANRWKYVCRLLLYRWRLTEDVLKDLIFQIIDKAEKIDLHFVTSDMRLGNMKLWKCCGINVGRYSELKNYHIRLILTSAYILLRMYHIC